MKWHDIQQNTPEWLELRRGKFTASSFKDLFAKETTATYEKAIYKVVYERLTNDGIENEFKSDYMKRGQELEAEAIRTYELETFNKTSNAGFFERNEWVGASPDALVGTEGLIEAKCPAFNTMINYLLKKTLPSEYYYQVHGQLFVTGRKWCDFLAYHPSLKTIIIRIERDEGVCGIIETKLNESIDKAKLILKKLNGSSQILGKN